MIALFPPMKSYLFLLVLSLLWLGNSVHAADGPVGADAAYAELVAFKNALQSPPVEIQNDSAALHAWVAPRQAQMLLLDFEFARRFPADPRHWGVQLEAAWAGAISPNSLQTHAKAHPESAGEVDALLQWATPALTEIEHGPAVPANIVSNLRSRRCDRELGEQERAASSGRRPDWRKTEAMLDEIADKSPDFGRTSLERRLVKLMGAFDPAAADSRLRSLAANTAFPSGLREMAASELSAGETMRHPLEMRFIAADGREVDLAKLRGKVVLIDFWATWCGPCVGEIPNVKKVYAAYHARGFEVVGIALENGRLAPNDAPAQTATKLAAARKILTDFTAKNEMAWPQYFDGKYWKNDISTRYAINSIPAMFLLDQDGRVVSTNARGEALEREVKRLLKL